MPNNHKEQASLEKLKQILETLTEEVSPLFPDDSAQLSSWRRSLAQGTISVTSPIGQALIGKEAGDDVRVQTPGGVKNLEILDIDYAEQS